MNHPDLRERDNNSSSGNRCVPSKPTSSKSAKIVWLISFH